MPTPLEWPLRDPIEGAGTATGIATVTGDGAATQDAAGTALGTGFLTGNAKRYVYLEGTANAVATAILRNYDSYQFYFDAYDRINFQSPGSSTFITLRPAEERERSAFPARFPALDAIRRHMLQASTSDTGFEEKARSLTVLAFSTELRSIFDDIFEITDSELTVDRPSRVKAIDIDKTLTVTYTRLNQAFSELSILKVPDAYKELLNPRLYSASYADRVSGMCAIVLLASILILEAGESW